MRLVVGFLALTLSGSLALADEAKAPEPEASIPVAAPISHKARTGLRVVRILPESNQALLFDKNRGTHVLAEVGSTIDGYTVDAIEEDEVTLSASGKELVLSAPGASASAGRSLREERAEKPAPRKAPADPYADAAEPVVTGRATLDATGAILDGGSDAPSDAPIDPYAEPKVREVSAPTPIVVGEGGIRVADAGPAAPIVDAGRAPQTAHKPDPAWMSPPTTLPATAPVTTASEIPSDPYGAEEPAPVITPTVLSRTELNRALADFGTLTGLVRGGFTAQGARLDMVAEGSIFAKAGLRAGDIVTAVDNQPLRTIDDAADLYVRASSTRAANISVVRAGKPLTLRVLIH